MTDTPDWDAAARRALRQYARRHLDTTPPMTAKTLRLAQAATALRAPKSSLRRVLCETLPPETDRRSMRLRGRVASEQGILNAGALLHWRLEDKSGHVHAGAYEKLFLRHGGVSRTPGRQDWLAEARALAGLRPTVARPGCRLPRLLGVRRHKQAIGVVTNDLRMEGFDEVTLEQAVRLAPEIATALAALATDHAPSAPFACRHLTLPACRPFFAWLKPVKLERIDAALRNCGITQRQAAATVRMLERMHLQWDREIVSSGLPWRAAHGDPYFRNIAMRGTDVALIDLEKAVIGPLGLDIGRFIGTTLMRGIEARARATQEGRTVPEALAGWRNRPALERVGDTALSGYTRGLHKGAVQADAAALARIARISALMGMCYGSSVILRASEHSPQDTAPLARLIVGWGEALVRAG